jgi:uncharacterized protein (DUF2141 family)
MILLLLSLLTFGNTAMAYTLRVELENLRNEEGSIRYLVFDKEEGYPDKNELAVKEGSLEVIKAKEGIVIENLPEGEYSFSIIHDENNNNRLDTNFLGIPKEGFGFSNNPTVIFGAPSFSKCKFDLKSDSKITIKMKYF